MEENSNQTNPQDQNGNKMVIVVVAIVALLAVGSLVYASMNSNTDETSETIVTTEETLKEDEPVVMATPIPEDSLVREETTSDETMMPKDNDSVKVNPTDSMVDEDSQVKEFVVEGSNFKFEPNSITVNKGDTVRIIFKNVGGMHDWKIDEFNASTKVINSGEEETIEFVADKAGTFEYYCSVGAHRANGMVGDLIVK